MTPTCGHNIDVHDVATGAFVASSKCGAVATRSYVYAGAPPPHRGTAIYRCALHAHDVKLNEWCEEAIATGGNR